MTYPPVSRASLVEIARSWVGTPYHHAAGVKGVGVDCAFMVCMSFQEAGVPVEWTQSYSHADYIQNLIDTAAMWCDSLPENAAPELGTVIIFRHIPLMYNHCGIFSGEKDGYLNFIHAYNGSGVMQVIEQIWDEKWAVRVHSMWDYRGFVD